MKKQYRGRKNIRNGNWFRVSFKSFGSASYAKTLEEAKEIEHIRKIELRYICLKAECNFRQMEAYQRFALARKGENVEYEVFEASEEGL